VGALNHQEIDGLICTPLREIKDERGAVLHMLRCDVPEFAGFGECYFSEVAVGAVKAWKRHRVQTQQLAVPVGRVRLVVFDARLSSPTNNQLKVIELGRPDAYMRVCIPAGVWYGFACISANPALIANCADLPHDPSESEVLSMFDNSIPYVWEIAESGKIA
jgi:dTDP-4-dehydrorhamnose 3,5-epimerase